MLQHAECFCTISLTIFLLSFAAFKTFPALFLSSFPSQSRSCFRTDEVRRRVRLLRGRKSLLNVHLQSLTGVKDIFSSFTQLLSLYFSHVLKELKSRFNPNKFSSVRQMKAKQLELNYSEHPTRTLNDKFSKNARC